MRQALLSISLGCLLAAGGFARSQTWIVDASNGPGAHFTDLPPAVAAAAAGDRILVRSGVYTGFRLSKALTIVGAGSDTTFVSSGGATYQNLTIENLPSGARAAIADLTASVVVPVSGESLTIANCQGTVVLDSVVSVYRTAVTDSVDVRGTACGFESPVLGSSSNLALDRCTLQGAPASFFQNLPALSLVSDAAAILSRCQVAGGDAFTSTFFVPASEGIVLLAASLVLTGDGSGSIAAGAGSPTSAIGGTGTADVDPHVTLQAHGGAPPVAGGVTATVRTIPSLAVDGGPPGGTVDFDLFGPPGDTYFLYLGRPRPPYGVSGLVGDAWIHPRRQWLTGTFAATGRVTLQVGLPNAAGLTGLSFTWQGFSLDASSIISASNPVSYVHGM